MAAPNKILVFIISEIVLICFCCCCDDKSFNNSDFLDPDNKVFIQWSTNTTHLTMKVTGKTKGWLGVGFSPTGGMEGSDIVMGWVANGKPYLQDRHGMPDDMGLPPLDKQQDYILKYGEENATHTIYCFERKLDTCDKKDYKLTRETTSIIFAFNDNDPASEAEDAPKYHGNNRGTSSQNLLGPKFKIPIEPDMKYIDFRMPNVSIPDGRDTYYWCQFFKLPDELNEKHHMIGYLPIFEKGHEDLMHHVVVYQCIGNNVAKIIQNSTGFECYTPMSPFPYTQCETASLEWSKGSKGTFYPDNVGFPFVNEINGEAVFYMFDTHYNNPEKKNGISDSSGLRIYYTSKLRPYDGGWLIVEFNVLNPYLIIPPGQKEFTIPGHCAKECLATLLPTAGIQVFGYILHTHMTGRKMKVRHYRNGTELEPLANNEHYNFDYQQDQLLQKTRSVLPGDSITLECTFNTEDRNATTVGGESSREEMCMVFIMYYSVLPIARCSSTANPSDVNKLIGIKETYPTKSELDPIVIKEPANLNNTLLKDYLKTFNWTDDQITKLQEIMIKSDKVPECTGSGTTGKIHVEGLETVNYPNATEYKDKDSCTGS